MTTICVIVGLIIAAFVVMEMKKGINLREASASPAGHILYVGGTGLNNYTSIQDAINDASDGDTIFVYSGTYYENVVVNKTINLIGESRNNTIIDGGGNGDVVYIVADWVNITQFTIRNSGGFYDTGYSGIKGESSHINVSDCGNCLLI